MLLSFLHTKSYKTHCFGEENEKFSRGHSPRTPFLLHTPHKHPHQLRHWCVSCFYCTWIASWSNLHVNLSAVSLSLSHYPALSGIAHAHMHAHTHTCRETKIEQRRNFLLKWLKWHLYWNMFIILSKRQCFTDSNALCWMRLISAETKVTKTTTTSMKHLVHNTKVSRFY